MMYRKFIATILATAVAVTGLTAAPARAGDDDVLKLLAGVAAVAIIGTAIAKNRDRDRDDDYVTRQNYDYGNRRDHRHGTRHHNHNHYNYGHKQRSRGFSRDNNHYAKPLPRRVQRKLLPERCRVQARTRKGENFSAFGGRCLQNNYQYANALPSQCAVNAKPRNGGKRRLMYGSRCLHDFGYRLNRR